MRSFILILITVVPLSAAFDYTIPDAHLVSTSESTVASKHFHSAYLLNPAISSMISNTHYSLFYSRPYGIGELNSGAFISNFRKGRFGFGLTMAAFGNEVYRESQVIGNFSGEFFDGQLAVGVNLRWNHLNVENYGSQYVIGMDAGLQYQLQAGVLMGFAVRNINQPKLNGYSEQLPIITRWGMSFQLTDRFGSYIALQKDSWYPLSVRIGILMKLTTVLQVHSGFNSNPSVPAFGLHLKHHWISVQYGLQYHFELGGTHVWGLSFELK